jgi:hypothetical protein
MNLNIRENSWIAKLAAKRLGAENVAIVIGSTIHLHNTSKEAFLRDKKWVKHELCHVQQFKKHGSFLFILEYLYESLRHGYYDNKYEVEARLAEES